MAPRCPAVLFFFHMRACLHAPAVASLPYLTSTAFFLRRHIATIPREHFVASGGRHMMCIRPPAASFRCKKTLAFDSFPSYAAARSAIAHRPIYFVTAPSLHPHNMQPCMRSIASLAAPTLLNQSLWCCASRLVPDSAPKPASTVNRLCMPGSGRHLSCPVTPPAPLFCHMHCPCYTPS